MLPHLDSAAYIIKQAAQIQHKGLKQTEEMLGMQKKSFLQVIRIWFFSNQQGQL